jgi:uncharacterized protein DUF397
VEATDMTPRNYRKSTYSGGASSSCVETGSSKGKIYVRDTTQRNDPNRTVVTFTADAWSTFLATLSLDTQETRS